MTGGADLSSIFGWVWGELARGVTEPKHPFRFPVVSTSSNEFGANSRIVVLRRAELETHSLEFYTDLRSDKIAELREDPRLQWVFWDPVHQIQLRLRSTVTIHSKDALADDRWSHCSIGSRVIFLTEWASGTAIEGRGDEPPPLWPGRIISQAESERGRPCFAVVRCVLNYVDFYEIAAEGQRRAWFEVANEHWTQGWMSP